MQAVTLIGGDEATQFSIISQGLPPINTFTRRDAVADGITQSIEWTLTFVCDEIENDRLLSIRRHDPKSNQSCSADQ